MAVRQRPTRARRERTGGVVQRENAVLVGGHAVRGAALGCRDMVGAIRIVEAIRLRLRRPDWRHGRAGPGDDGGSARGERNDYRSLRHPAAGQTRSVTGIGGNRLRAIRSSVEGDLNRQCCLITRSRDGGLGHTTVGVGQRGGPCSSANYGDSLGFDR